MYVRGGEVLLWNMKLVDLPWISGTSDTHFPELLLLVMQLHDKSGWTDDALAQLARAQHDNQRIAVDKKQSVGDISGTKLPAQN